MYRRLLFLLVLASFFTFNGLAASVGTVPGFDDIGEVEPGETIERSVYITTTFDRNFTVEPEFRRGRDSVRFRDGQEERFETSEQDITDWVEVEEEAFINPNTVVTVEMDDGSTANTAGSFEYTIEVPSDAESGYHYGGFRLNPQIEADGEGAGTVNWGETRPDLRFKVAGNAERELDVRDVRSFRLGESKVAVEVLLTNRGTVTTSTNNFELDLFDSSRNRVTTLGVTSTKLEPGGTQWVETTWTSGDRIEGGQYQIDGEVDYITGSAVASGSFNLPDFDVVEVQPSDSDEEEPGEGGLPLWLVLMVLALLGVLMYSFEIDPFWILLIVGVLGISAFVLMTGVPTWSLILLLILVGIVVYSG